MIWKLVWNLQYHYARTIYKTKALIFFCVYRLLPIKCGKKNPVTHDLWSELLIFAFQFCGFQLLVFKIVGEVCGVSVSGMFRVAVIWLLNNVSIFICLIYLLWCLQLACPIALWVKRFLITSVSFGKRKVFKVLLLNWHWVSWLNLTFYS